MNRGIYRFIPMLFFLIIIGLIIAAAISVVRMVIDGNNNSTSQVSDRGREVLLSETADRSVRLTVRGPIVGDETFRSYQVTVSPGGREFVRYKGYLEEPLVRKSYPNNAAAYDEFVHALDRAGFTAGKSLDGAADDTRGVCAEGIIYEFEVIKSSEVVKHLWASSCDGVRGSFTANVGATQRLFLAQVPAATEYIGKD